ncbi:PREDICTED: uncharacterized protein LOC106111437 isoform X2 [Papilio polytes]|nr:PREDICTED: uncharacterized protein LOC106111437 isoform X2 [Papilio polytes]
MSGMTGASMLRTRRKDVNVKPNRKLDRKSSRGMLYENEELRLRTININAEVERGQSDIKKLKRENEQLKREISALRYEYDRLDSMLRERRSSPEHSDDSASVSSACPECASVDSARAVAFHDLSVVPEEAEEGNKSGVESPCTCEECRDDATTEAAPRQDSEDVTSHNMERLNNVDTRPKLEDNGHERTVDEMTTSHSEHERTNSVCSSMNSLGSACTHKSRKLSAAPQDGAIPWCGCWGAGCV